MPGKSLNNTERKLLERWRDITNEPPYPTLRGIMVFDSEDRRGRYSPGLRGIKNISISFDYPLSILTGKNGVGKSTILALSALGFHSPKNHVPFNARRPVSPYENYTYYTFSDFFYNSSKDADVTGLVIMWHYGACLESYKKIIKYKKGWSIAYAERPQRPVHYLGISRGIPAVEISGTNIRTRIKPYRQKIFLKPQFNKRLNSILGRDYKNVEQLSLSKSSVRECELEQGETYSSFNMGAGEDNLINILFLLQEVPEGSLIIIEELEYGIHQEALKRFARHLQEIMLEKKLQVIASTHSEYFIDSVPREARILLQKTPNEHIVVNQPSTELAISDLSGRAHPELYIYCEDSFAKMLLTRILIGPLLQRVRIISAGGDSAISKQIEYHFQVGISKEVLAIWDGDVSNKNIENWMSKLQKSSTSSIKDKQIQWLKLPGDVSPERWMIRQLKEQGKERLAKILNLKKGQVEAILEKLSTLDDQHNVGYELSLMLNLEVSDAFQHMIEGLLQIAPDSFKEVIHTVKNILK